MVFTTYTYSNKPYYNVLGGKPVIHSKLTEDIRNQLSASELGFDEEEIEELLDHITFTAVLESGRSCCDQLRITASLELL